MKKFLLSIFIVLFILMSPGNYQFIQASYGVQAILPENQVSQASYFDIELTPGETQILEVNVFNEFDEEITVLIEAHPGVTNVNGLVVYDGSLDIASSTNEIDFYTVVEVLDKELTIPANSETIAQIEVTAPDSSFDGEIGGGLNFSLKPDEEEETAGIGHTFGYVTGLYIVEEGNDNEAESEVVLNDASYLMYYGDPSVQLDFENLQPLFMSDLEFEARVYSEDNTDEPVFTDTISALDIAPSYEFSLIVSSEEEKLDEGEYRVEISMKNDDYNNTFEKVFTVSHDE